MNFRRKSKELAKITYCQNQGFLVKMNTINKLVSTNIEKIGTELNDPKLIKKRFTKKNYFLENSYLTGKNYKR